VQACAACGAENPDGHRFCWSCGAALSAAGVERRKLVTSVFCDLSGSTAMGERADAETVFATMNAYFEAARDALERHGGTVEKFIGDAVVGMFGVPEAHEDDALRACRAAIEIQERIASLNTALVERHASAISVRIGVNTGEVVAGATASRAGFASGDAVVLGDAVNTAARLEESAAPGEVLLGEQTHSLVRDGVTVEAVAPVEAKGKSEPLVAFRLLAVTVRGSVPRRGGTVLVGRNDELTRLEAEFDKAVSERRCRLVTVVGDAGVGKSRLALELLARIGERAHLAHGGCLSYGEGITYWPVAQIVRELAGIRDDHTAEEAVSRVTPRIAQLLGLAEGSMTSDQAIDAVAEFVQHAAADGPLVAFVDDIHWAEPALLDLFERLPRLVDAPVLLLCLARPELREHRPNWPVGVDLEPLGSSDVDALLESLDAPAAARVRIAQTAAGNPLYTEELVAWAHDGGDLDALPTSLNALLSARLDRLDAGARDALERGAVEGELFHQDTVLELTDEAARATVSEELAGLTRKDLIRLTAGTLLVGEVAYRFKHILVREAAYRATTKRLRASLHERYADWLEQRVGGRVGEYHEILGYHVEQAYRYRVELGPVDEAARALATRAARHLDPAGRRANDRGDVHAAANLLGRAAALLPADSLERLELLVPYAYAVGESGRGVEARSIDEELYERATALGERRLAMHARLSTHGEGFWDPAIDFDERRALYEEGIETFTALGDEAGLAKCTRLLGRICRTLGQAAEAAAWSERALVHANACSDLVTRRVVTQSLAMTLTGGPMPVADAIRRCEELREANTDDRVLDAVITRCLSELYAMAGRFDDAREAWEKSNRVLDDANMMIPSRVSQGHAASARELAGDRAGAEQELVARWRYFSETRNGAPDTRAMQAAHDLANLYCDWGRWEDAEECLAFHRDVPLPVHMVPGRLVAEARVAAHLGELVDAAARIRRAVELIDGTDGLNQRARVFLALAEVMRAAGQDAEADTAVATALELYEQKGNVAAAARLQASAT
jgi:class 3 adenylate cyclase/tetratricopeptide (TPR) repeat protein